MNSRKIAIIATILVSLVIFASITFFVGRDNKAKQKIDEQKNATTQTTKDSGNAHAAKLDREQPLGSNNQIGVSPKRITLTTVFSFACPHCKQAHDEYLHSARDKYKDQIVFEAKHFPLKLNFPNSFAAHRAAEAAAKQGKFWEVHDKLFESQTQWQYLDEKSMDDFLGIIARDLGLNVDQFETDFASQEVADIVVADEEALVSMGVNKVPTVFVRIGDRQQEQVPINLLQIEGIDWFEALLSQTEDSPSADNVGFAIKEWRCGLETGSTVAHIQIADNQQLCSL